ncbi:hypothetical protein AK830_g3298 [Neonectria ditissima]|uniref:Integral membrane protein n=1 Tax=Neonectria ditissima TaxID=78410 RepID=A0A0N8H813_9HYPO|nr:hypothetical protein AK830_g3298 [Neonectria ditissima]
MGRFGSMVAKAGEIVQQANLEYQRRQQQGQQGQQQQQQGQYGQDRQGQYGQYGQQGQYGQPQHPHQQPYTQHLQQPAPSPSAPWQHQAEQELSRLRREQAAAEQQATEELARLRQQQATMEQQAAQELARLQQQADADRQYAERLAAQFAAEEEEEQLRLDSLPPPPVPPRPMSSVHFPAASAPALPPRPGVVRGAGRAVEGALGSGPEVSSNNPFREGFEVSCGPDLSPRSSQGVASASSVPVQVHSPQSQQVFPPPPPPRVDAVREQPPQQGYPAPPVNPVQGQRQQSSPLHPPPRPSRTPEPPKPHPSGITPLAECSSDAVTYDLDWFYHPNVPSYLICGRCYIDHIYDTSFGDVFAKTFYNDKKPRRCLFGARRMKDKLWPEAVSSRNIGPAVEFMEKRANMNDCPQAAMKENETWYTTTEIPGMTMCKACFEDDLMATPFGNHFQQRTAAQAFCDSTTWYVRRIFENCAKTNDWAAFAEGVKMRIQLPACPKQAAIKANDRAWFKSSRGPEGLQVCVACYYDYFHGVPGGEAFERVAGGDFDTRCVMGHLNILIPTHQALGKKDMDIFWTAIRGVDSQPFCDGQGTTGATNILV